MKNNHLSQRWRHEVRKKWQENNFEMIINLKVYNLHRIVHTKNTIPMVYNTKNYYILCV